MIERPTRANARLTNALVHIVLLFSSGPAFAQSFRAAATFTAGAQPHALVVADFNHDTRPDLALAVSGANAVAVLLADEEGGFLSPTTVAVGSLPRAIVTADFNQDGELDLAVANSGSNTTSILLGHGGGGFDAAMNISAASTPLSLAVGDFNADGKPDLVIANSAAGTASLRLGNGTGAFAPAIPFAVGTDPRSVAVGDFNGDGKPDVAVANYGSNTLSILLGTGTGGFAPATTTSAGTNPIAVCAGQLNADGKLDLVIANNGDNTVSVRLGDGAGGFTVAPFVAARYRPVSVGLADVNGDGKLDLAVANQGANSVSVALGNGNGGFATEVTYGAGDSPRSLALADLNDDGSADIVTANSDSNDAAVIFGDGAGGFEAARSTLVTSGPRAPSIADFNADGYKDLAIANFASNDVAVLLGDGAGGFTPPTKFAMGTNPRALVTPDLNGDGKPDLVTANNGSSNVSVRLGAGGGAFGPMASYAAGDGPWSVTASDFNGDGKPDLAVVNVNAKTVSILLGNGAGAFTAAPVVSAGTSPRWVASGDFNLDGKADLVVTNDASSSLAVLLGEGTGAFSAPSFFATGTTPWYVVVADFNLDSKPDLAVANFDSNSVSVLLGTGTGAFDPQLVFGVAAGPRGVAVGDLDGNGKLDLVTANETADSVSVLLGSGTGSFGSSKSFGSGSGSIAVAVGDFASGTGADLAVAGNLDDSLVLLVNTTPFRNADLALSVDDGQAEAVPGQPISYTMTVTNLGPDSVTRLTLSDPVPPSLLDWTFTPSAGTYSSETGSWTGLNLGVGQSQTLVLSGTVDPAATGNLVNLARVTPPVGTSDTNPSNDTDSDTDPLIVLSIGDVTVTEGNAGTVNATFLVGLSSASSQVVTVGYATADGTATSDSDYVSAASTVTFSPGQKLRPITVTVKGDAFNEPTETFVVNLSDATNAYLADNHGVGTITNDDPLPTLSISNLSVAEGDVGSTAAVFTVALSSASGQLVTVNYATANGTAAAGSDYAATSGALSFPAGTTTRTITVNVAADFANEPDETFFVNLSSPALATLADAQGRGTILNDDILPFLTIDDVAVAEGSEGTTSAFFTVALSAASGQTITVNYATADGTAAAGPDYDYDATSGTLVFYPGMTVQYVPVRVRADEVLESVENYFVNLTGVTAARLMKARGEGWIVDSATGPRAQFSATAYAGGEAAGKATIVVTRTGPRVGTVTVDYETSDGTAKAGLDYTAVSGTLTFSPAAKSLSFVVPILNDTLAEGPETVLLRLSSAGGVGALGNPVAAVLTVTDNDLGGALQFAMGAYQVSEAGPLATITVTRTGGLASGVTVDYSTADGSATEPEDYASTSGTLFFGPGVLQRTFSVPIHEDAQSEGDETFDIALANPTGGAALGPSSLTRVTITENEPTVQLTASDYSLKEAMRTALISVRRSGPLTAAATVHYATSDGTAAAGTDYALTTGTLTFAPKVALLTFAVPVTNDTRDEGNETVLLSLSNASGAALGQRTSAVLTLQDDDPGGSLQFSLAGYSVKESTPAVAITVSRTGGSASDVTVDYSTSDGTAVEGTNYQHSSGTLTFGAGVTTRTFTVPILKSPVPDGDRTVQLTLTHPTGGGGLGPRASALLTVLTVDPVVQFSAAAYAVAEASAAGKATITVTRAGPTTEAVTVDYATSDGSAQEGLDYTPVAGTLTFPARVASQTFTVPILPDLLVEPDETIQVALSSPSGAALGVRNTVVLTILSPNPRVEFTQASYTTTESSKSATITVKRTPVKEAVTADYAVGNGTAQAGSDYTNVAGTLVFGPGVAQRTFLVPLLNDTLQEVGETVHLALSNASLNGFIGAQDTAVLTVASDDAAGSVQFNAADFSVTDLGPTATITVTRTGGKASGVTVDYAASDGSAAAGTNYLATQGTLIFGDGQTSKTFSVPILDDLASGPNRTLSLTLSDPTGGATLGARSGATLWIVETR